MPIFVPDGLNKMISRSIDLIKRWHFIPASLVLSFLLVLGGCGEPEACPELVDTNGRPRIAIPAQHQIIGRSVQNRPIVCQVFGSGPDVVLIMATIHGNEPAGTPLVRRLATYLEQHESLLAGRTVVLLPVANPDGMAANTRRNVHGVDLNRNFIAQNRVNNTTNGHSALCEPESRVLHDLIEKYRPDRIVSIHQPLACIDYDGPAAGLAMKMGEYCDLPVKRLGARPGSLGSYVGVTLGTPIITFEMLRCDSNLSDSILWQKYGKALLAALVYPDVL